MSVKIKDVFDCEAFRLPRPDVIAWKPRPHRSGYEFWNGRVTASVTPQENGKVKFECAYQETIGLDSFGRLGLKDNLQDAMYECEKFALECIQ